MYLSSRVIWLTDKLYWKNSDVTFILHRIILIIVLKNPDVYSAPSVGIHIFGYALTGVRPKQDGVRSDFFPLHSDYQMLSFYLYIIVLSSEFCYFSGSRIAVSFTKQRMEMDGLNIEALWFLTGLKR